MDDEYYFDEKFWQNEAAWPRDWDEAVFLARVIVKIEKAMYPEPLLEPAKLRSDQSDAEFERIEDAQAEYEAEQLKRRRLAAQEFVATYQAGKFDCLRVPKAGGQVQELTVPIWFSQACDHWFRFCDFAPESSDAGWSNAKPWIFVSKRSVEAYFGKPAAPLESSSMTPHYSPYMMLMMDVVRDLKITPDYQPLVDVIREELRKRWPHRIGIEVSKNLVDAMATIVREIESGKGGFNKSRRKN